MLAVTLDAAARIRLAPSPLDAERERFRHRRERAIREIGMVLGKLPVQSIAVGEGDVLHLGLFAELRHDVVTEHGPVCSGRAWAQAYEMLLEALGQSAHVRRVALGLEVRQRVAAEVDLAAQALRLRASLRARPIVRRANRVAAP